MKNTLPCQQTCRYIFYLASRHADALSGGNSPPTWLYVCDADVTMSMSPGAELVWGLAGISTPPSPTPSVCSPLSPPVTLRGNRKQGMGCEEGTGVAMREHCMVTMVRPVRPSQASRLAGTRKDLKRGKDDEMREREHKSKGGEGKVQRGSTIGAFWSWLRYCK